MINLNSKNKRILVFSDPHQEIDKVLKIIKSESADIIVCLGDWFDSFHLNSEHDAEKTCNFLKEWVLKENFYTCIGNHDVPYLYNNPYTLCSGYYKWKDALITKNLGTAFATVRNKFQWYIWIDDFLCSHAGLNEYYLEKQDVSKIPLSKWIDERIVTAEKSLFNNGHHWLYMAGAARGGRVNIGGITWQDFNSEFEPIDGLKQLVGHTAHSKIIPHHTDGLLDYTLCENLDIDSHLSQYLIIHNEKLEIKNYSDL
jgi:hypothetical protein